MSLDDALLDGVDYGVERLLNKSEGGHDVEHVLQVTSRTRMSVCAADCNVIFGVQISKPFNKLERQKTKTKNLFTTV